MGMITTRDLHTDARRIRLRQRRVERVEAPQQAIAPGGRSTVRLNDGEWIGEPCFIVGGGPSLKGFDFERLRGRGRIIVINRAVEFVPFADIHFFMDHAYMKDAKDTEKWAAFQGRHVFLNLSKYQVGADVISVPSPSRTGLSTSISAGIHHGNNSGVGAIGLAHCLGANPIYLLGYDCKKDGDAAHFHDGYGKPVHDRVLDSFIKDFTEQAQLINQAGVTVVNLNPDSAIRCFPFGKLDDIQAHKRDAFAVSALGFGDNLYQRSILRQLAARYDTLYLKTTCPDIYWDIPNIRFVDPGPVNLRTQRKHIESLPSSTFSERPVSIPSLGWRYQWNLAAGVSHIEWLRQQAGLTLDKFDFTFPVKREWIAAALAVLDKLNIRKRLCIVRPSTIRKEWYNASRNPKTANLQLLIDRYKDDYFYLSFGDLELGAEWLDGELRGIDAVFYHNELPLTTLFGLIKISDMVITGPTWAMVAAIAERVKCFTVFGGCAKPEQIIDASMGLDRFAYAAPDPFCNCKRGDHSCNKEIPADQLIKKFEELRSR